MSAHDCSLYLRYCEFHRIENGKAVESYIYLDIPELMMSCDQWLLPMGPGLSRGRTGMIQGPASRNGFITTDGDPADGEHSYKIVTDILSGLATKDETWRPYWHENMMWYGSEASQMTGALHERGQEREGIEQNM